MATLRQLLTKAFAERDENWPIIDIDTLGEYCPVEAMPEADDDTIDVGTASEGTLATFPLDVEIEDGFLKDEDGSIHAISVNVLKPIIID